MQRAHAALDAVLDQLRHALGGNLRDHVVQRIRDIEDGRVAGDAADLGHLRVDGVERVLAVVALLQQGVEEVAAHAPVRAGLGGDPDNGHAAGVEDLVEGMRVWTGAVVSVAVAHGNLVLHS